MKRYLFFLNYRAGSTLFQHICCNTPHFLEEVKGKRKKDYFYLPTIPPIKAVHTNVGNIFNVYRKAEERDYGVMTHIGNWWGNRPEHLIPTPYQDRSPTKWSKYEVSGLMYSFPADWKFVNLLRDGRNQIESFRRLKGGVEEKFNSEDPEDYFKGHCLGWRNKARIALDCQAEFPNYRIFRFEDLMSHSEETLQSMFSFLELEPDMGFMMERMEEVKARKVGKKHSSFKDDKNMHNRWKDWEPWEVEYFKAVANKELQELGYEW